MYKRGTNAGRNAALSMPHRIEFQQDIINHGLPLAFGQPLSYKAVLF
jgi:hypothetical protein